MKEFDTQSEQGGPFDQVIDKVFSLSKTGKPDEVVANMWAARFKPDGYDEIDWILLRSEDRPGGIRTAIIRYVDQTTYDIDWRDGEVWSFRHRDPEQAEGRQLERVLPYSGGRKRADYVSNRFAAEIPKSNLADTVMPQLVDLQTTELFIDNLIADADSDEHLWGVYTKDIDPKDIDVEALCAPILTLTEGHRVYLYPPDFE